MFSVARPIVMCKPTLKHNKRFKIYSTAYKSVDPYRESSLRYMGYANELGEAFTSYLPEWGLPASYCVAAAYVMFDTIDKGEKAYNAAEEEDKMMDTVRISTETFTWQMLASVFWPGSIIRVIVNMAATMISNNNLDNNHFVHFLPTLIGLSAIPMIVKPIDTTVDKIMEGSISKVINGEINTPEEARTAMMTTAGSISVPPIMYCLASIIKKLEV
jgi:mitochondrial fission process protein 1